MPVARRVLGEANDLTLKMRWLSARALYKDPAATLDDLREAVTTLEETARIARRVFGNAHPLMTMIEDSLQATRAALHATLEQEK
jgi:predicted TIM-barrel fold metal-dependent hydrolase